MLFSYSKLNPLTALDELVATTVAPHTGKIIKNRLPILKEDFFYKMVSNTFLLANHQESRFKVKTYVGEKTSFLKDLAVRVG